MWLINSSIGRKVVMSVTGTCLVLFLLFHGAMNLALVFSPKAYNAICSFLGANWYAVVASMGLAALALVHIVYAFILTFQNRMARGADRYAVTARQEGVDWSSKNMLVLGVVILGFLVLHLYNFWFKMQFAELTGLKTGAYDPQNGAMYVISLFNHNWLYVGLYLVWLCAIWLHLTHGIWSAMQTMGFNNEVWMKRWKVIAAIISTLVVGMFAFTVVYTGFAGDCMLEQLNAVCA